jgi:hypothetical protein
MQEMVRHGQRLCAAQRRQTPLPLTSRRRRRLPLARSDRLVLLVLGRAREAQLGLIAEAKLLDGSNDSRLVLLVCSRQLDPVRCGH